jgi:Jacalin-like lectin domain
MKLLLHLVLSFLVTTTTILSTTVTTINSTDTAVTRDGNSIRSAETSTNDYYNGDDNSTCTIAPLDRTNFGPNFRSVPPANTIEISKLQLSPREYRILSYYAQISLPPNTSSDDYVDVTTSFTSPTIITNPYLNSRADVTRITSKYIARILLGCSDNNTDMDTIVLDDTTVPFAMFGTSGTGPNTICARDGDYDFSTIDFLQLLYVARQYPNSMPLPVFHKIRDTLLTIRGTVNTNNTVELICQLPNAIGFGWIQTRPQITVAIGETENHILQTQISRYLTNQLLLEADPLNQEQYNNTANGNTEWLLRHLSTFVKDYFYEYNSKPYQLYTVKALTVLHAFATDRSVVMTTEILLDIITAYSAIQMNALRRFVPYRRKPAYNAETLSWKGDSEFYRLSVLVGNYHTFTPPNYTIPGHPSLGGLSFVSTVASTYRINDCIFPLFLRNNSNSSEYYISHQNVVEMYYATPHMLISSGGHETKAAVPTVSLPNRFCFFKLCLWDGGVVRQLLELIYSQYANEDRGWSRPTTIIPSNENSNDLLDMIRFQGHRSAAIGRISRNLCVGPNFACGLQLLYGNVVEPILDTCSIVMGDWRFIDFTTTNCLNYGYYMAVYTRSCDSTGTDECTDIADNYGLLEISEPIMSFETFQQTVLSNNPKPFVSKGIHTYVPISDAKTIQFEINPRYEYESQLLAVESMTDDASSDSTFVLDRNYRNYPKAWSSKGSFQSISAVGRWTFDNAYNGQRCICDVTDPLHPIRITSKLPQFYKHPISVVQRQMLYQRPFSFLGRYFDDSTSVLENDSIEAIQFHWNAFGTIGFRMKWRNSGLQSTHGDVPSLLPSSTPSSPIGLLPFGRNLLEYEFAIDEHLVSVGIGTMVWFGRERVNRIRMVTNQGRSMIVGYGRTEDVVYNTTNNDNHIIAFYGRASDDMVHQLGVTSIMMIAKTSV